MYGDSHTRGTSVLGLGRSLIRPVAVECIQCAQCVEIVHYFFFIIFSVLFSVRLRYCDIDPLFRLVAHKGTIGFLMITI